MKMSKRFTLFTLVSLMVLSFAACDLDTATSSYSPSSVVSAEPAEKASSAVKTQGEGDVGKYHIKIVSSKKGKDYAGKDALIVTYEWKNNGDKETMFSTAFSAKAYQNGVECELAIGVDGVDSEKSLTNIKPGASLQLQEAYVLNDQSDVSVEVSEWLTFDDNPAKVEKVFSVK